MDVVVTSEGVAGQGSLPLLSAGLCCCCWEGGRERGALSPSSVSTLQVRGLCFLQQGRSLEILPNSLIQCLFSLN